MIVAKLRAGLAKLGLDLSPQQEKQLLDYLVMIAKWNKVYNLTAIRDAETMLTHHILDSLAVIAPLQRRLAQMQPFANKPTSLLDVGAGAGLPGVVIAICCPDVSVTCVDAVGKKAAFIQQAALTLGLTNLKGLHVRVESMMPADVCEGFDVITSRAFASLEDFVSLTSDHLAKPFGVWMAMKAKTASAEALCLPKTFAVFHVEPLLVPDLDEERCLVWVKPQ
jgi:16S rRNA (guanine527-N7)-methyltransferase